MTTPARVAVHTAVWLALCGSWLVVTRGNQPTWGVAVAATLILVGASAVGVYADWYALRPWLLAQRGRVSYLLGLLAVVAGLTFLTVPLIQVAYDAAGIPKEGRFGFWTNVSMEAVWYAVHIGAAAVVRAIFTRRGKGTVRHEQPN